MNRRNCKTRKYDHRMSWWKIVSYAIVFLLGAFMVIHSREVESKIPTEVEQQPIPRVVYKIKAYCPKSCCCGRFADGITASGYKIKPGDKIIAAPSHIPFGTKIDIPGYGIGRVEDRGWSITSNMLEVYFDTHQEAVNWGVKYSPVRFYEGKE